MKSTIEIAKVESLRKTYPGQSDAQRCYVWIDKEARTMGAEYNPEIGNAVSSRVWHGIVSRYSIPALSIRDATRLLRKIRPLAEILCDGFHVEWDGSNRVGNHMRCNTEAAKKAALRINAICDGIREARELAAIEADAL